MRQSVSVVVAVAWLAVAAGCNGSVAGPTTDGRQVFASVCAACHGPTGKPPASMVAATGVRDLTDPAFRARITVDLVKNQVRRGSANKLMPAFAGALSEDQITAVAAFVVDGLGTPAASR